MMRKSLASLCGKYFCTLNCLSFIGAPDLRFHEGDTDVGQLHLSDLSQGQEWQR